MNIATLFSGGEGVGVGARMAGVNHLWGIEYDDKIAQVARNNNFNTITADVLDVDPNTFPVPDILHASPVCTRASVANSDGEESDLDLDAARKTAEFIKVMKPRGFTLENVYPYREFKSFKIICNALIETGYSFDYWHLNSADYGVPQTRKRLILMARLDGGHNRILPPVPTHHNPAKVDDNQLSLFAPTTKPWVGWYEAIEDLIPFLPESQFAPWQLERLPDEIKGCLLKSKDTTEIHKTATEPSQTVTIQMGGRQRAFIIDGKLSTSGNAKTLQINNSTNPVGTVVSSHSAFRDARAYLVNSAFPESNGKKHYDIKEPAYTVDTQGMSRTKALLLGNNANDTSQAKIYATDTEPAQAVRTPSGGRVQRAWLSQGRVVKMTPRALVRFQSFPDWYRFPDNNTLAVKVIGNAVPPLMYCEIVKSLVGQL